MRDAITQKNYRIPLALIVALIAASASGAPALGKDSAAIPVAEAKVYPAPGNPHITDIEVYEPVAGILFQSLKGRSERILEGRFSYIQKTDQMITCSEKMENDKVQSHFCVMHMLQDGTLLSGIVASFDNSFDESSAARGHGEIRVLTKGHGRRAHLDSIQISAQAAHALYDNLQVPLTDGSKAGTSLVCSRTTGSESEDSYRCSVHVDKVKNAFVPVQSVAGREVPLRSKAD